MKTLQEIDFTPLQETEKVWRRALKDTFRLPPLLSIGILIALGVVVVWYMGQIGFWVVAIVYGLITKKIIDAKSRIWREFARANDWYIIPGKLASTSLIPPGLPGPRINMSDVVHAEFEGRGCDIFMYHFTTGKRHNRAHYYTVARVSLPALFPHLILDSRHTLAVTHRGNAGKHVSLEGNFDKHFSLYCEEGKHIDALSIITPDIMDTILSKNLAQDIEIIGTDLYLAVASDHRNMADMQRLFVSIDALADEISHKAKTIKYQPVLPTVTAQRAHVAVMHYNQMSSAFMGSLFNSFLIVLLGPIIIIVVFGLFLALIQSGAL